MPPLTVYLITKNEEKHLAEVLAACAGADEILVVDSGSTDRTLEIARAAGARVVHQEWLGFAAQKNFALTCCRHEWVLHLDGDEVLSPGAIGRMKAAIAAGRADGFYLRRDDRFMGASMSASHCRPFLRLYRRAGARWDERKLVHEHVDVPGRHELLPGVVLAHHGYDTVAGYMDKLNRYSVLKARMRHRDGRGYSFLRLIGAFPLGLVKHLLFRRMLFSGTRGWVRAMQDAYSTFLTEAMLLELSRREREERVG
jgi:glycosyltransferase involved in cell wall biosynthesis